MIKSTDTFGQARLKHVRANQHISQLESAWNAYLKTDFCHLAAEGHPDGGELLSIVSFEPLPAEIVLLIGDAIHNLKSALDYTISEMMGWGNTRLTFPMGEAREELVSSFRTDSEIACAACGRQKGKGRNAAIEEAVPGIGDFIVQVIRPYKAANGFLWPLNKLDVRDKHRLLIPVVVPQTINDINVVDNNENRLINFSLTGRPGQTLSPIRFGAGGIKIESYGKPTAQILFNETGIIEGQPVLPTLVQMSQAVSETIDRLEEFFRKAVTALKT